MRKGDEGVGGGGGVNTSECVVVRRTIRISAKSEAFNRFPLPLFHRATGALLPVRHRRAIARARARATGPCSETINANGTRAPPCRRAWRCHGLSGRSFGCTETTGVPVGLVFDAAAERAGGGARRRGLDWRLRVHHRRSPPPHSFPPSPPRPVNHRRA